MEAIQIKSIQDLYTFVESAIQKTGLILDSDAVYRPWARALDAQCRKVRWGRDIVSNLCDESC